MNNFIYHTPTQVVFGTDTEKQAGELIKAYGATKVLIHHYGNEVASITAMIDSVKASLEAAGLKYITLDGIVPNPRLSKVYEGIKLCKEEKVDFILAIGGGSAIDSSKAIGLGSVNEGDVWDFYTGARTPNTCIPVGAILTIPASGSEMSAGSVITQEETGLKRVCFHPSTACKFAIMNPDITLSLPPYQTACGCADILMHTLERYFAPLEHLDLTDAISEGLMKTVITHAKILKNDPQNKQSRWEVMWAGSLSHNGLTGCGMGITDYPIHCIGHELSGHFDVTHGASLTAVYSSWARHAVAAIPERLSKLALNVLGIKQRETMEETALCGIEAMEEFFRTIGVPTSLKELHLDLNDAIIEKMAEGASGFSVQNPDVYNVLTKEDAIKILKS